MYYDRAKSINLSGYFAINFSILSVVISYSIKRDMFKNGFEKLNQCVFLSDASAFARKDVKPKL